MTPQEIYRYRFCLGHPAPNGDLRAALARQLEGPVPNIHPGLKTWQEIAGFKSSRLTGEERKAQEAITIPGVKDYWDPLLNFTQTTDRPFLARLMLDIPNAAPTSESRVNYTYSFWVHALQANLLSTHGDWLVSVILGHYLYRYYLNTNDNVGPNSQKGRVRMQGGGFGPGTPPDENLARELHEILSVGDGVLHQETGDMSEAALLLTGLRNEGFDPIFQEPGDRVVLGKHIKFRPDTSMIEEYLRWLAVHPKTAEAQIERLVKPILGTNLTPNLRAHLAQVWADTGGDRRKVLQAMVMHDDAWSSNRGAPVNTLVGFVTHLNENRITPPGLVWQNHLGYRFERAPDPEGLPMDERLIGASFLLYRTQWPGTAQQRHASMHYSRIVV